MSPNELFGNYFWLLGFFVFLTGLCIGSFLNVVALRALSGESIVLPPSKCPECNHKLHWYNNIPVFSYIFLMGKCRFCKCHISLQYPLVELFNALLYFVTFYKFGLSFKTLFICILMSFFILMVITDFREKVVFDAHTYPVIVLGLIYNWLGFGDITIVTSITGALVGLVFFEVVARLGYLFAPTRAFGEGDTIIAMGIGAFFGWKMLLVIIFASIFLQAAVSIPLLLARSIRQGNKQLSTAIVLMVLCTLAVAAANVFDIYRYLIPTILMLTLVVSTLLWCVWAILSSMKNKKEEDLLYLPFGPALVFCTIAAVFLSLQV